MRNSQDSLRRRSAATGFTLIELLVVIAVIAVLAALLFPVFLTARVKGRQASCSSNLRQLGAAIQLYASDNGGYPRHSSPPGVPKMKWPDYIFRYVKNERVFLCPGLDKKSVLRKTFAHNSGIMFGGYGYNYQYLGNSRIVPPSLPFSATDSTISAPSSMAAVMDVDGVVSMDGNPSGEGAYVADPPIPCGRGSGMVSGYYETDVYANGGRAMPTQRHNGYINVAFVDGHVRPMRLQSLDDLNADGVLDNGYWNGHRNPFRL